MAAIRPQTMRLTVCNHSFACLSCQYPTNLQKKCHVCSLCRLILTRAFSITCRCTRVVGLTPGLPFLLSSFDICWELRRPSWELLVLYKHQLASATIFNRDLVQVEVFRHDLFHKGFVVAEDKLQKTGLVYRCKSAPKKSS